MTINIRIERDSPDEIMEIVRELRKRGHAQGIHFDFRFVPVEIDPDNYTVINKKHTMFIFYKEELATWFSLIYQ